MRGKATFRAVIAAATCVVVALTPAGATTETVEVRNFRFEPDFITIQPGDTIRWIVRNGSHTVSASSETSARGESFDSSDNCRGAIVFGDCLRQGDTFSHRFTHRGTFTYFCEKHGSNAPYPNCGMCGRVRVASATSTVSPTNTASPSGSPTSTPTDTTSPTTTGSPTGSLSPGESPNVSGPSDGGSTPVAAIAAVAVSLLGAAGFFVWRTLIRR